MCNHLPLADTCSSYRSNTRMKDFRLQIYFSRIWQYGREINGSISLGNVSRKKQKKNKRCIVPIIVGSAFVPSDLHQVIVDLGNLQAQQSPDERWRAQWPKRCDDNKDRENCSLVNNGNCYMVIEKRSLKLIINQWYDLC